LSTGSATPSTAQWYGSCTSEDVPAAISEKLLRESRHAAQTAQLKYVSDEKPGIRRLRAGAGFKYLALNGRNIRDSRTLSRIKSLVIPPAWEEVWICPDASGHIQAVGRDQRGRKQYLYHPR